MSELFDARIVVGPLDRIEEVDDGACELLGYTRPELLAMHGTQLVPREDHPSVAVSVDLMRRGEATRRAGRVVRKDKRLIPVEVRASALPGGRLEILLCRLLPAGTDPSS